MLATKTLSPSFHQSPTPMPSQCSTSIPRSALADSTNTKSRPGRCGTIFAHAQVQKRAVCPASSVRLNPGSNGPGYSTGTPYYSRQRYLPCPPSPFPVAYKGPPTVSVSLSAACSQNRERVLGARVPGLEPDLPEVTSVVPFPCTPLDGDGDVEMLDGSRVAVPAGCSPFVVQAPSADQQPRKRRSAHSSISSSQSSHGKKDFSEAAHAGTTRKRARKSRRQVVDLWWLGVVLRSISSGIAVRQSVREMDTSHRWMSAPDDLDAADRLLMERIRKRLVDSGCFEGRAPPSPLSRKLSPTISLPSLGPSPVLAVPILQAPSSSAPLAPSLVSAPKADITLVAVAPSDETAMLEFPCPPVAMISTSLSLTVPVSQVPSLIPTYHKPHVRLQISPTTSHPHPSMTLQRSPSPPPRTATALTHAQPLTLTLCQLVAALTLAHRERSGLRPRGRPKGKPESQGGQNLSLANCSPPASQADQCGAGAEICGEGRMQRSLRARARLLSAPERTSPLSRVAYVGAELPLSGF
ncbi:hypothetical protein BU15DRAFT_73526 [Melanogaster broomeanus]|nr:hypothetical protein BU15DRAFT_73526 [Melanogaster broomeanus]